MSKTFPSGFLDSLKAAPGFTEKAFIEVHQKEELITSVRLNPFKPLDVNDLAFELSDQIPWSSNGYYLDARPSFTSDPLFHAGAYYVQEASSMFLEQVMRQTCNLKEPLKVLDLCAAPGGKSTLIQSLISEESMLVSNEVIKPRVNILAENISKWGAANVVVSNNDPRDFARLPGYFDLIVVDAPCSGSGLFRKDPDAMEEWSLSNVALCSQRQQRILFDVIPSLKPGGILIYSTCSYSVEEDEAICDMIMAEQGIESVQIKTDSAWNIVETISEKQGTYGYRFYPDRLKGEGFFIAAFRKKEGAVFKQQGKGKQSIQTVQKSVLPILRLWVEDSAVNGYFQWQQELRLFPAAMLAEIPVLQNALYLRKAGIQLGELVRQDLIPAHELAMSHVFNQTLNFIDVDLETALNYLRRQDISLPASKPGWALIKFKDLPLGWVKILPNRVNNYYPKDWRILNK